jgi:hypothetical protein
MKKALLISGVLLALAASTAMAGGVNLSWSDCGSFGDADRTFACNTNSGSNTLVVSFEPMYGVPDFAGNETRIDLASTGSLPAWWQMYNSGTCRGTAVPTINATFGVNCGDNFAGAGFGAIGSYTMGPNTGALLCGWAIPSPGVPITTGVEYYAINVVINNSKTVGTGACGGCSQAVCLSAPFCNLAFGPNATLQQQIMIPLNRNFVTWQGGLGVPGGCPGATPTQNKTWGAVKSLYR